MKFGSKSAETLWSAFCNAHNVTGPLPPIDQFGDSPELADELLALVLSGQKQATCELKYWFDLRDEKLPLPGDYWIITNGAGMAACIIQTTQVDLCAVRDVDPQFAWDEGEGDRSLSFWKTAHDAYFERQATRDGFTYSDDMICVCERFVKVWPMDDGQ